MHLGTIVVELASAARLAIQKHGSERGDAELLDRRARVQVARHLNLSDGPRTDFEAVRARYALTVQNGIDRERAILGPRPHQPEIGEPGEFLTVRRGGVECKSAGGKSV